VATSFTPLSSTLGGMLIGLSAAILLARTGKIAGISGIAGGLLAGVGDRRWRGAFILGLLVGGFATVIVAPGAFGAPLVLSLPIAAAGGLLVGIGTRLGGGCTSGHGVCGLSRGSKRSFVATMLFMAVAMATVFVTRHVVGGG
jgi:uncharacterized membrane protein YedE/YeeE